MDSLPLASGIPAAPTTGPLSMQTGAFQPTVPATAALLDRYPQLAQAMDLAVRAQAALSAMHDGTLAAAQAGPAIANEAIAAKTSYINDHSEPGSPAADPARIKRLDANIERARAAASDANVLASRASSMAANHRDGLNAVVRLLNDAATSGAEVEFDKAVEPPRGDLHDYIAKLRDELSSIDAEEKMVRRAPMLEDDAVAMARDAVRELARPPRVSITDRDVTILPPQQLIAVQPLAGSAPVTVADAVALVAFVIEDELTDAVERIVRSKYAGVEASFDAEGRADALNAIGVRRLIAERNETAALQALWARGDFTLGLRAQVDAKAFLNIATIAKPKAAGAGSLVRRVALAAGSLATMGG